MRDTKWNAQNADHPQKSRTPKTANSTSSEAVSARTDTGQSRTKPSPDSKSASLYASVNREWRQAYADDLVRLARDAGGVIDMRRVNALRGELVDD